MKSIRVGAAQGFYGDSVDGAIANAKYGNVDYLAFDALAELTMAILAKDKDKNPDMGYTRDLYLFMKALLPYVKKKRFKILTNAGGLNPKGAQAIVLQMAKELGITDLKVAVVTGDNILSDSDPLKEKGVFFQDVETKRPLAKNIQERLLFANAYLGAQPLVEALRQGADIVISGRTTDTAQFLAPLIYEFGWLEDEWDRLASGVFMGHLLECSAQSTGGNFIGGWQEVEGYETIGYPIAEVNETGEFVISKVEECGGIVNKKTIKEQMLYEIHDPAAYVTPDVVMDVTNVQLEEIVPHKVKVTGVKGKEKPPDLKVVMGYADGFLGQVLIGYCWPDALQKAKLAEQIIYRQMERKKLEFDEIRADYVGYNSLHGPLSHEPEGELNEIYLRMAVKSECKQKADSFFRLFPPLGLNGPPSMSYIGNIPTRQQIGMWSSLIPRTLIEERVTVEVKEV
ncbi:acyclic terpene utilization AtuA family protein [Siminovitchia sp. FSL H7-0308]|uniref:acyclic terpene utilization AtuA family protein n=1 Tax=Siminovitchia sp. FSL H7-0308 TaxID=2921432 RepID=UPI0030EF8625